MPPMLRKGKMETSKLYDMAEKGGVAVSFLPLCENAAFSVELDGKSYIAINKRLLGSEGLERVMLAHELGHLRTGGLCSVGSAPSHIEKTEKKADSWAISALIPKHALVEAMERGDEDISSLADRFCVTEEFMSKALKYYSEKNT